MYIKNGLLAVARIVRTWVSVRGKSSFLRVGSDLHIGKNVKLWAPKFMSIGSHVYIGKDVTIEANCEIGDYCLIANRVAIIGRHDHDFRAVGVPVRYSPWIGSGRSRSEFIGESATIGSDVWLGYSATVLTGTTVGRGAIVAAGSVVVSDIPPYGIAVGVPARVIGYRFDNDSEVIKNHEESIREGTFAFSELGFDFCTIKPGRGGQRESL
jgi:acetyltransferase-like isoleucine patch superfamily enzyme